MQKLKLIFIFYILMTGSAHAVVKCLSNCNTYTHNFTENLTNSQNQVGKVIQATPIPSVHPTVFFELNGEKSTWAAYIGQPVPASGFISPTWTYQRIDDYISVALADSRCAKKAYFPYNYKTLKASGCEPYTYSNAPGEQEYHSRELYAQLRIDKKMVSGTYTKNIFLAEIGLCEPYGCTSKQAIMSKIYANVNITVPESCVINAGQVVTVDFGPISASAFQSAGAVAQGVNPITRNISIECQNIAAASELVLRLQANNTSGNAIVSNNADVGFQVADTQGKALIPNNLSSVIRFILDNNERAIVPIKISPVSITGNRPTEGAVTSEAFLRVDFP
ncbi:fimbrial protein [Providencia manganoxydans]|uniref:fimbrial protein n=1 Tax=Providencia manganoxydans TaxID=2923283 RepID=UPI0032DAA0D6